jgi:hypothetical protein
MPDEIHNEVVLWGALAFFDRTSAFAFQDTIAIASQCRFQWRIALFLPLMNFGMVVSTTIPSLVLRENLRTELTSNELWRGAF